MEKDQRGFLRMGMGKRKRRGETHLLLDERKLIEIASEEVHLALLSLRVRVLRQVAVVLPSFVEGNLKLDDL